MTSFMEKIRNFLSPPDDKPVMEAKEEFDRTKKELVQILEEHGLDRAFKDMEDRLKNIGKKPEEK